MSCMAVTVVLFGWVGSIAGRSMSGFMLHQPQVCGGSSCIAPILLITSSMKADTAKGR